MDGPWDTCVTALPPKEGKNEIFSAPPAEQKPEERSRETRRLESCIQQGIPYIEVLIKMGVGTSAGARNPDELSLVQPVVSRTE